MPGSLNTDETLSPLTSELTQTPDGNKTQTPEQAKAQADRVFAALKQKIQSTPEGKIALLYAANNQQAKELHQARKKGNPIPRITGSGQAQLFQYLIPMINDDLALKGKVQILPIATSLNGGNNTQENRVTTADLNRDLSAIKQDIDSGYEVLGIPGRTGGYAIGGGESKFFYDKTSNPINGKSQGEYVQEQLKLLEQSNPLKLATDTSTPATPTIEGVYSKLGNETQKQQLQKIVAAYEQTLNSRGTKNKVTTGIEENEPVLVFHFDNASSAEAFFKKQATTEKIPFDMTFKGQDRRMYSDGSGQMVIGTKQEVDDYKDKKDNFTVDEHGHLSRKAVTAGSDTPASSATPPTPNPALGVGGDSSAADPSHLPGLGSGSE